MSALKIIDEFKKLPANEQVKVAKFIAEKTRKDFLLSNHPGLVTVGDLELWIEYPELYKMKLIFFIYHRLHARYIVPLEKIDVQLNRLESRPVDQSTGLRSDQIVWLSLPQSVARYPDRLRRVSYRDPKDGRALVFLTNNFDLPALVITQLYKGRWQVELFFKWIKQNLRIKHFFGTTANAVKTQVWIAICVYVLVAIVRKELGLELSLSQILQILSVNVFEQVPLAELVARTQSRNHLGNSHNQLMLWD